MLMQPQSPNPDFYFMLKDKPKAARSHWAFNLHGRTQVTLAVIAGVIVLMIAFSVLSSRGKSSSQNFVSALARANETLRITSLVQQQQALHDPQTLALAATVSSSLTSDKQQIASYLAKNHVKLSPVQLSADLDKSTDASLQTAAQNNGLDAAYVSYLKTSLAKYETDLQAAYNSAGPNGKKLLAGSFVSARALLNSAPIKT
jgi:hypothetical protein